MSKINLINTEIHSSNKIIQENIISSNFKTFLIEVPEIIPNKINDIPIVFNGDSGVLLTAIFYSETPPSSYFENILGKFIETSSGIKLSDVENIENNFVPFYPIKNNEFNQNGLTFRIVSEKDEDIFPGDNCIIHGLYRKTN